MVACLYDVYIFLQASRLIVTFDEHVISNNFKFGVIYQKFGQVSEKARLMHASFVFVMFGP